MRFRDKAALSVAPLLLRLVLGVTFLWAGLGKVSARMEVQGEQAAILANAGVTLDGAGSAPFEEPTRQPEPIGGDDGGEASRGGSWAGIVTVSQDGSQGAQGSSGGGAYSAADFPDPIETRRVNGLVIGLYHASHPGYHEDTGERMPAIWPTSLGEGGAARAQAWAVALGEIVCGAAILVGLLTRVSGLGLALIMAGAIWLSQIGPAIQSGDTVLGFLPSHGTWDGDAWKTLFWQASLLASSLAVVFLGAGPVSVDHLLFRPKGEDGDGGDESEDDSDD